MKNFRKISFYENIIVFSLNKKVLFQKLLKEAIVSFSFSFFYWEFQKFIVSYAKKHKRVNTAHIRGLSRALSSV